MQHIHTINGSSSRPTHNPRLHFCALKCDFQYVLSLRTFEMEDCINLGLDSWEVFGDQLGIIRVHELPPHVIPKGENSQQTHHEKNGFHKMKHTLTLPESVLNVLVKNSKT